MDLGIDDWTLAEVDAVIAVEDAVADIREGNEVVRMGCPPAESDVDDCIPGAIDVVGVVVDIDVLYIVDNDKSQGIFKLVLLLYL